MTWPLGISFGIQYTGLSQKSKRQQHRESEHKIRETFHKNSFPLDKVFSVQITLSTRLYSRLSDKIEFDILHYDGAKEAIN